MRPNIRLSTNPTGRMLSRKISRVGYREQGKRKHGMLERECTYGKVQQGNGYGILVKAPKRHVECLPRYSPRKVSGLISDE